MATAVLSTLWFQGFNMTIDGYQMYKLTSMEQCQRHLNYIIKDMYAERGMYFIGDIRQKNYES